MVDDDSGLLMACWTPAMTRLIAWLRGLAGNMSVLAIEPAWMAEAQARLAQVTAENDAAIARLDDGEMNRRLAMVPPSETPPKFPWEDGG